MFRSCRVSTWTLLKRGQSRLYFLRKLVSVNVCSSMLQMFFESVVASVLFYSGAAA